MERRARDLVQLLCDLSEASDDVFQDAWLGDECRQHIAVLATMGVIEPGPTPATVTCTMCDADHAATLNYDPASRRYVHFCPEAGFVAVNDADLATHRFRPEWLVDWIVRELPITSPPRRRAIVPECVWHLGDAKCGDTWVTAIFARRISNLAALERLASEVRTIHPAEKGIVLTTSMHAAGHVQLPGKYELLPLMEVIRAVPGGLMLDIQRLGFWLVPFVIDLMVGL